MSNLPMNWVEVSLNELLADLLTGKRPKGGVRGITQGVLSLGGEHVSSSGKIDISTPRYISEDFARTLTNVRLLPLDILIVKDGATTGKVGLVDERFRNTKAFINEHLFLCRPYKELDFLFIYHYLRSEPSFRRLINN
ncbi:MAG: hypothetical protein GC158_07270 [Cyanobacteria bacterium RI_101]|nr:hypothetical protein [Cyanobacteria bacterium RI_101]